MSLCYSSSSQQQGVLFQLIFIKNNFKKQNNNWGFNFKKNQEPNINSLSSSFSKILQNLETIVLNIEFFHESIHGISTDNIKRDVNDAY